MSIEITRPPFALYPEEKHWWSFNDYGVVLSVTKHLREQLRGPLRVLEFGPGNSTLALIEGGATYVHACEDNPIWLNVYQERLARTYPVKFIHYEWSDPLSIPWVTDKRYDLALIDGPYGTTQRPAVLAYCLERCDAVLMPTEDVAYGYGALRPAIKDLAKQLGRQIEWIESGPLSGAFALITRPSC